MCISGYGREGRRLQWGGGERSSLQIRMAGNSPFNLDFSFREAMTFMKVLGQVSDGYSSQLLWK